MPHTPTKVIIHPLVLLSVVDHFNRNREHDREKRVVGALLGSTYKDGTVAVFNAYAVPFDEDEKEPNVWFLDHNYHERMYDMHQKVSCMEQKETSITFSLHPSVHF
jgi:26S proteasome regulatory subunit N8